MKACLKCKVEKEAKAFHKTVRNRDGLKYWCKTCHGASSRKWYQNNRERCKKIARLLVLANPEKCAEIRRRARSKYMSKNPEKIAAQKAVQYATKTGRLVREACEVCGTEEHIHGHHDDYSRLLDVRWLCHKHHAEHHSKSPNVQQQLGDF